MALRCLSQLHAVVCKSVPLLARPALRAHARTTAASLNSCRQCVGTQAIQARNLATKKSKAKSKGHSQARVNINAALVEDIINIEAVNEEMHAVMESLKEDFSKNLNIRTSPGALDHIIVVTKDGKFPLNHIGQISLKSPQLIIVNMTNFPESTAAAVKAIRESKMNLNPEVDGMIIRVQVPPVTREHRENLAKLAKQISNKAKDTLRRVRTNAVVEIRKSKNSVSEDTIKLLEKQIQQMADDITTEMDNHLVTKTKELLG
ncbi:ribosome-recycling factor, mitochondrial [Pleurodeles waltl]|uniref:ribosome-recycling factor, mitochondrial n=1 Tax=Pleurodeles waltl TaxID=8319 RepID=UPI0037097D39